MSTPERLFAALAGALVAMTSCSVGPDYERPTLDVPPAYKSATPEEGKAPGLEATWWTLFGDPRLTELEEAAIRANQDLKAAVARVDQARAATRLVRSDLFPSIIFDPTVDRVRTSPNVARASGRALAVTDIRVPLDLSYEVDLWGRIRRSVETSEAQARATANDLVVVLHTIQADVAQTYFTLRLFDSQIEIVGRNLESYRRQLSLLETQFRAGLVGRITVVQAETQLNSVLAQETDLRRQRTDLEHALATLLGRPPSGLSIPPAPLNLTPPTVPAGLPADLLRRRPDVAEAEQYLAAASAQIGVAEAQFYPALRLTAAAGFESLDLRHLPDWQSRIWSIGAGLVAPLFQGGRLDANLQQARARFEELLAAYRSRVLVAFRDVEVALTDIHLQAEASQAQARAVESSREYLRLAETQYQQGLLNYFQVIDAQRTLLANELSAAQTLNQRLLATVLLIKAIGAGWEGQRPPAESE